MKLQNFEGGVNSRLAPQLVPANQGVVYENIDNATGTLTPEKDKEASGILVDRYSVHFEADAEWVSSAVPKDYVEFRGTLYSATTGAFARKYSNGVDNLLGITKPNGAPTLVNTSEATPLTSVRIGQHPTGGNLPPGKLEYLLFNVKDGVYSKAFWYTVDDNVTEVDGQVISIAELDALIHINTTTSGAPDTRRVLMDVLNFVEIEDEARLYRLYEGEWHYLGSPNSALADLVYDISAAPILDRSLISLLDGTYQYVSTFYNAVDGTESGPSPVSDELSVVSGAIALTISSLIFDSQVTHIRIYRVGGSLAQFTLVSQIPYLPGSFTQPYTDTLADNDLDGRPLETANYAPPPAGLRFFTEAYAMLFGAIGSSLRFTPIGVPDAWPAEFEIQFNQDITAIGQVASGILVCTRTKTYLVTGTGPTVLTQQLLRGDQGCISFESMVESHAGTVVWASEDGLCLSSGNTVKSVTKGSLNYISLSPVNAVVHNEVYYCLNEDGKILAWDYRLTPVIKWLDLDVDFLVVGLGKLYGHKAGELHELFQASTNVRMRYKSPRFVEGAYTNAKTYKKVYIRSEGDIIINIIINNIQASSHTLSGEATTQLQVPQPLQRGYSIQFEIEGTGVVEEFEYLVEYRQNG